ncbi:MAG: hypothetical protein RR565_04615 [Erysipelothrix sp.]
MLEQRRKYLILTSILFIVGFILYGILGIISIQYDFEFMNINNPILKALVIALVGGYFLSSIMSGIIVVSRFISKRTFNQKILLAIFFFVPIYMVLMGAFYSIPYGIYNFIQYRKLKKNPYAY